MRLMEKHWVKCVDKKIILKNEYFASVHQKKYGWWVNCTKLKMYSSFKKKKRKTERNDWNLL